MHFIDDFTLLTRKKPDCLCAGIFVNVVVVVFFFGTDSLSILFHLYVFLCPIELTHVWLSRITCCDIKTPVKSITPLMHMSISTNEIEDVVGIRWPSSAGSVGTSYCSSGVLCSHTKGNTHTHTHKINVIHKHTPITGYFIRIIVSQSVCFFQRFCSALFGVISLLGYNHLHINSTK